MRLGDPKYPKPSSVAVTNVMKANLGINTKPEVRIRSELHRRGYRFRKNYKIVLPERRCKPDIVFTKRKLAIFIDGCFWHFCPQHGHFPKTNKAYWKPKLLRTVERDKEDKKALEDYGWNVIRIWEHVFLGEALKIIEESLTSSS